MLLFYQRKLLNVRLHTKRRSKFHFERFFTLNLGLNPTYMLVKVFGSAVFGVEATTITVEVNIVY